MIVADPSLICFSVVGEEPVDDDDDGDKRRPTLQMEKCSHHHGLFDVSGFCDNWFLQWSVYNTIGTKCNTNPLT